MKLSILPQNATRDTLTEQTRGDGRARNPRAKKRTNVGIAEKYWKILKGNPKITVVVNGSARIRPPPVLSAQTCHASQEES